MAYDDIEAELRRHPAVRDCVVKRIRTGPRKNTVVAYVVTSGEVDPAKIREYLSAPRLRAGRIPRAVIRVESLPRAKSGAVDRGGLPLPVLPGPPPGGKTPWGDEGDGTLAASLGVLAVIIGAAAFLVTDKLWPGSTDLSAVPQPWAGLFFGLYVAECLSFGLGATFLMIGRRRLLRMGRPRWLTNLAHVSIGWLLGAWWPQDNLYRLAAKDDWARQAELVYGFNITLMIAAAVLVAFAVRESRAGSGG